MVRLVIHPLRSRRSLVCVMSAAAAASVFRLVRRSRCQRVQTCPPPLLPACSDTFRIAFQRTQIVVGIAFLRIRKSSYRNSAYAQYLHTAKKCDAMIFVRRYAMRRFVLESAASAVR